MNNVPIIAELPSGQRLASLPFIPPVEPDPDRHFRTDHLQNDLGRRSARATAYTGGAQAVSVFLRILSTVVLARLLTPEDYGLFGMVTVLVSFISMFNDFGLSMATIQKEKMTHTEASTLFWVNVGVSCALALLLIALSPVVVWFYHEPRLFWLNIVLALSLIPGGLRVQHGAILRRQMRFGQLALVDLLALIVGIATGIIFARLRHDYWSLAAMHWGSCLTACIGTWIICGWRPGLSGRVSAVAAQLRFGAHFTGSQILFFMSRNLDNVLVGKFAGGVQLGLYDRAFQLMVQPMQQVTIPVSNVAAPTLCRLQSEPIRLRKYFSAALSAICYFSMPLTISLAILSDDVILLLLGPAWTAVSSIYRVLAFAALVEPIGGAIGWLMISQGNTDRMLRWSFVQCPVMLASFALGLPWGAIGVATAYTCCRIALIPPSYLYYLRDSPVTVLDVIRTIRRPMIVSAIMAATMFATQSCIHHDNLIVRLLIIQGAGLLAFSLVIVCWSSARLDFMSVMKAISLIIGRGPKSQIADAKA
jgi:O-antigen/teichoic acid export membrane protein